MDDEDYDAHLSSYQHHHVAKQQEDEDEDEDDDDGGDQEEPDYEQDFELEQKDRRGEGTHELQNGSSNGAPSPAGGLITLLASQQQQTAGKIVLQGQQQGQQQVVVDSKPNGRIDWTEAATHALLEAWGERYVKLNKGNLKQDDWDEVVLEVSAKGKIHKTDVQCKNRLDTLKKKFKVEKQKQSAVGSNDSKWPFYKQLDKLLSAAGKRAGVPGAVDAGQVVKSSAFDSSRGEHFTRVRKSEGEDMDATPNNTSTSSKSKESPDMTYNSPPDAPGTDGTQSSRRKRKLMDTPFKTLAKAITKFGEIYEKMEQSKQQQVMDLEKIRMEFTRDLELQRMQLFMQTQVELAKMKHGVRDIDATASNLSG